MVIHRKLKTILIWSLISGLIVLGFPDRVRGEVKPITDAQDKLNGITEEEQKTLEKLFTITQELEELEREEKRLSGEIDAVQKQVDELDRLVDKEQKKYDDNLELLKQVLVSYQRTGPASYLEILLQSESLTSFLKNINLLKDISRNTGELLDTIEAGKEKLSEQKQNLSDNMKLLEDKKEELKESMADDRKLKEEQEVYLAALKEEKVKYEDQLSSLKLMWQDLKDIFSGIVDEFSRIISEGYFTMEDLNLNFNLFSIRGSISEDTFNRIIKEHSTLPEIVFHFNNDNVVIEVPEKKLLLTGRFEINGKAALKFVVESGSFYGMPLEAASIDELFKNGPLLIDFDSVAGDLVIFAINIDSVETKDGSLNFTLKLGF